MNKDMNGEELKVGDKVKVCGLRNRPETAKDGTKTISDIGELGGTTCAWFNEGGGGHALDALIKE